MAEIDRQRAVIARRDAEIDGLVAWIAGDADAHSALMAIYADPRQNTANKTRAAGLALPFEKAKPAATINNVNYSLFHDLDSGAAERRWRLREAAAKVIEHVPARPGTVLGEGAGEHGAWHPLDSDKGDPAA
jgi:hypothetical protein